MSLFAVGQTKDFLIISTCTAQPRRMNVYSQFLLPNQVCLLPYTNPDCKGYRRGLNWLHKPAVTRVFAEHYHHLQVTFLPTCRSRDVTTTILVIILSPAELRQIFVSLHQSERGSFGRAPVSGRVTQVPQEPPADKLPLEVTVRASFCSEDWRY